MKGIIDVQWGAQNEGTERRNRRNSSTGKDCELLNCQNRDTERSETANQYKCITPAPKQILSRLQGNQWQRTILQEIREGHIIYRGSQTRVFGFSLEST